MEILNLRRFKYPDDPKLNFKLAAHIKEYRWCDLGDGFDYKDWDEVYVDGKDERLKREKSKYSISVEILPEKRKRKTEFVSLMFDDDGVYIGIKNNSNYFSDIELKEIEKEMIMELLDKNVLCIRIA